VNNYDCSIKEKKGCNYCLRRKDIFAKDSNCSITVFGEEKGMRIYDSQDEIIGDIQIRYCPVCGRKL
jgi:hypothetical protein